VLLLSVLLIASCTKSGAEMEPRGDRIPVVAGAAQQRALPMVISAIGTVESTGSVAIQSRVDSPVVRVFVKDGSEVKAGGPLLQIDP
jgi:multidrug efflux system membrane fusion protein